jgi:glycosyltransferase involved in cell wall biosynthesis
MHIVFVSREYPPTQRGGGIASYVKNVAESLAVIGHRVSVIRASDDTGISNDDVVNGVRVISLSGGDFIIPLVEGASKLKKLRCLYRFFSYRKKIWKTILSLKDVDIVEVPEYGAEGYYLKNLPCPVTVRLHGPAFLDIKTLKKKKYRIYQFYNYWCAKKEEVTLGKFHYITSCSESLKKWFEKYLHINPSKIAVIYNPINFDFWPASTVSAYIKESPTIFFAGTVVKEKGVGDLVESCKILHQQGYDLRLIIAGKLGKYGNDLRKTVSNEKLTWCEFLGNVTQNDLSLLYQKTSVACFPSWWDNFPMVCIEAMMCGTIVIGSSSGGMSEIITDGEDGFLLEPRNPLVWANKIKEIFSLNEDKRFCISSNAKKKIHEKFNTDVIIPQMIEYYQWVIGDYKKNYIS